MDLSKFHNDLYDSTKWSRDNFAEARRQFYHNLEVGSHVADIKIRLASEERARHQREILNI